MSYELLVKHIRGKIDKVNINNPKANWGARVLKELSFDIGLIEDHLFSLVDTMQVHFNTNNPSNPSGQAGLTMMSMAVGGRVLEDLPYSGEGKMKHIDQIRIGDLFIEPFIKYGFLELVRPPTKDSMYFLHVTDLWTEIGDAIPVERRLLRNTKDTPFTDGCLIKGTDVKSLQDRPWRRSASKLMNLPWKINRRVYEALVANKDMFVSEVPLEIEDDFDKLQEIRRVSKLMDFKIVTRKAKELLGHTFYQEVEADYRGRIYYCEPFLNFQGSDWARGMLQFAEGKPITESGKWWLAVHTAASFNQSYDIDEIPEWVEADYRSHLEAEGLDSISVDKFTLEDRVRWTNENMEVIIEAGRSGLFADGAEKPISFLACCIEWYNISRGETISFLPVPVDGSNNGWQHLGAISKDRKTGSLVGLVPSEIQSDFYVQTAKELLKIDDEKLNNMPMKHIRKGISKRGSMTRAYSAGAGKIGENMWYDCKSEDFDQKYDLEEKDCKRYANELIKAINVVCPGPLKTMEYMQELASFQLGTFKKYRDGEPAGSEYFSMRKELNEFFSVPAEERDSERIEYLVHELSKFKSVLVKGNGKKFIRWDTPSGFPVHYDCFRYDDFKCRGTINGKQIKHVIKIKTDVPDVRGFMCGISPNYVHSQDASHMAMVIDEWDGAFGAVHDSFSAHACDVEDLVMLTKQKFVDMYEVDNYFDKIRQDITRSTDDVQQPTLGSLEIQEVYNSDYFFA